MLTFYYCGAMPTPVFGRTVLLVTIAVVTIGLSGCAPAKVTPAAHPTSTHEATKPAAASPSPTPSPSATLADAPTSVFGGTCGSVFSPAFVTATLGAPAPAHAPAYSEVYSFAPLAYGGIACNWEQRGAGDNAAFLDLTVMSATSGVQVSADSVYCYGDTAASAGSQGSCSFSTTASGYWASGVVYTPAGTTNTAAKVAATRFIAAFSGTAAAAGKPIDPGAVAGPWSHTMDCDALSAATQITTVVKSPGLADQSADLEPGELPEGYAASLTASGVYACNWSQPAIPAPKGEIPGFTLQVFPGGGRTRTVLPEFPGQATAAVSGADYAYTFTDPDSGGRILNVFSGNNMFQLLFTPAVPTATMAAAAKTLVSVLNAGITH
jgi:hypothetical protein